MDIESITIAASSSAYGVAYLQAARGLYHHWRETSSKKHNSQIVCNVHSADSITKNGGSGWRNCCYTKPENQRAMPNGWIACAAIICAWFWPLAVLVWFVRRNPPMTSAEMRAAEKAIEEDRARLESELDKYHSEKYDAALRKETDG